MNEAVAQIKNDVIEIKYSARSRGGVKHRLSQDCIDEPIAHIRNGVITLNVTVLDVLGPEVLQTEVFARL